MYVDPEEQLKRMVEKVREVDKANRRGAKNPKDNGNPDDDQS